MFTGKSFAVTSRGSAALRDDVADEDVDEDVDEDSVVEDPLSWAPVAVQAVTAVSERRRAPVRAVLAKGRVLEMKGFIAQLPFSYVTWVI
ncbi:hypothetical protein [Corynebacterium marinum]|uniref:hypothetical protein n=1 Tax=Corynebacterium marinum TaxID=349751 RepID=UPI001E30BF43|nr:hypothetical protein [Corynebacterium marinum]